MKVILFKEIDYGVEDNFIDFTDINEVFIELIIILDMNGISTIDDIIFIHDIIFFPFF